MGFSPLGARIFKNHAVVLGVGAIIVAATISAACGRDSEPFLTYFSNRHAVSLAYPASWNASQDEKDGVWYRTFQAPSKDGGASGLSVTLSVGPFTEELDFYARAHAKGAALTSSVSAGRPGLRGREYSYQDSDGTAHQVLLFVPEPSSADPAQTRVVFGLEARRARSSPGDEQRTINRILQSFRLERADLYAERAMASYAFALRVPASWTAERTLSREGTLLAQYRSPPLVADRRQTAHASLTLAIQNAPGDGSLEAYYKSIRDTMGDAFPVLSHEAWRGGYADEMRTETTVTESRIKRYYRVAAGRGYSLTCEAREDVFAKMSAWCDIIASSLRVGSEVGGS